MTEKYIVLDIWGTSEKWVNVVQGEAGARELKIKLVESGEEYDPTGLTARFYVSDGGGYNHFVDADINDGMIGVIVPSGLAPGIAKAQVVLSDNDSGPLITVGLTLNVIPCTLEDAAEATDEWSPLIEALEKAEGAAEATDAANAAASAANAAAEAANEAADAANEAAESIADKVDTVDALPVYAMARSSDPTDCWQPTPGIAVPDTGPYTGMAIRAVWEEEWDASVPIWAFGGTEPVKPEGTYPAGAYILMWDGEAFQLQANMDTVKSGAIPVHTMALKTIGTGKWGATPAIEETSLENGACIRAVWLRALNTEFPLEVGDREIPIRPEGIYPGGTYLLAYNADADIWTIQSLDMAYTDERAEQAADEAAEAHAAQVRRTYQPAWKRTAGGCPVSVADAAEGADLSSLVLKGRTVVSGTPSPDAPVTITGVKPQTVAVTGKNLLPYSEQTSEITSRGITMRDNADGTYTFNGTADGSGIVFFRIELPLVLPSGWYTLNPQGMKTDNSCLTTIYKAPTYYTARGNQPLTFYLDDSKGPFALGFQFASDTVLENVTVKPMLTYGQESREFEPYHGETITPDEVELYGDAHAVGKNLIPTFRGTASVNGVTVKLNTDGSITLDGTATEQTIITISDFCLAKGDYVLSSGAALPTTVTIYACKKSTPTSWLGFVNTAAPVKAISLASQEFVEYRIMITRGTVSNLTIYPQLEAGSEATAYEPYQGMTTALEDGDSLDLATGEVVRRWKRLELDGTEAWVATQSGVEGKYRCVLGVDNVLKPATVQIAAELLCTHYLTLPAGTVGTWGGNTGISINSQDGKMVIYDSNYDTADVTLFKAYLAAQKEAGTPVTVLYKLKEPEVVSDGAHSLAQPEGEMVISALGTRGETAEAVDTEALYTYRPDWDDVLSRLAESEVQQAEMQTVLEQVQAKLAELTATE